MNRRHKIYITLCLTEVVFLSVMVMCGWFSGYNCCLKNGMPVPDTVRITTPAPIRTQPVLTKTIPVYIPALVDTQAIIRSYYSKNAYADTVTVEKYGTITITDTVLMNGIDSRLVTYDLHFPTVKRRDWSIGIGAFGMSNAFGAVGSIRYRHLSVFGGYDFINKSPLFGGQYIINL